MKTVATQLPAGVKLAWRAGGPESTMTIDIDLAARIADAHGFTTCAVRKAMDTFYAIGGDEIRYAELVDHLKSHSQTPSQSRDTDMLQINSAIRKHLAEKFGLPADATDADARKLTADKVQAGELDVKTVITLTAGKSISTADILGAAGGDGASIGGNFPNIRVKGAGERYSETKSIAMHSRYGKPVMNEHGAPCMTTSELETAKAGAFLKWLGSRANGMQVYLTDHDKSLVNEMFAKDKWCGNFGGQYETGIDGARAKALLSDSTSGGLEINPEWFDEMIITFPLLHSELVPNVTMRSVPRGAAVEAASVGNPTATFGTQSGSEISLFNTASLVAAIDSTIFPVSCAVEVGRDLMNDTPAAIGQVLTENIGQSILALLDKVIVKGNGTSEPEGITVASGVASVPSTNGTGGPITVSDFENLMFAIGKQYRNASNRCAFVSNDTTYGRRTGLAVSVTDQRRVLGMTHNTYETLGWPHKIQNDLSNSVMFFGALAKYILYRRQGSAVEWFTQDAELARRDKVLLLVRGRYAGKVTDVNAFAKQTDAKS